MNIARVRLGLAALAGVGALVLPGTLTAAHSGPAPLRIETHGVFTGPDSVAGTFTISGALSDSGTFVESLRFGGTTVHGVKTLVGREGTITLEARAVVRWTSPTEATLFAGHWRFVSGTGAYVGLKGGGHPGVIGSADLAAGTVDAVHEGKAHGSDDARALSRAGNARGVDEAPPEAIAARVADVAFAELAAACAGAIAQADFRLVSPDGRPLGSGSSCVRSVVGCEPFSVGCRQVVEATLHLELAGGTLVAPITFRERFLSESTLLQLGTGRIASGSGVYAGAQGSLVSAGTLTFTETGIDSGLRLVILLSAGGNNGD